MSCSPQANGHQGRRRHGHAIGRDDQFLVRQRGQGCGEPGGGVFEQVGGMARSRSGKASSWAWSAAAPRWAAFRRSAGGFVGSAGPSAPVARAARSRRSATRCAAVSAAVQSETGHASGGIETATQQLRRQAGCGSQRGAPCYDLSSHTDLLM